MIRYGTYGLIAVSRFAHRALMAVVGAAAYVEGNQTMEDPMYGGYALIAAEHKTSGFGVRSMSFPEEADVLLAARTDACVLVTGTGPVRAIAELIHRQSGWSAGPFEPVDCGAPAHVLESRVFRILEADLRPAVSDPPRPRRLQAGTLFLHDVGRLDDDAQARLLEVLDASRRGPYRVRRRIVASTPESLLPRVEAGTFNGTLFYRLNVLHFVLPDRRASAGKARS